MNNNFEILPQYEYPFLQELSALDIHGMPIVRGNSGPTPIDENETEENDEDFGD